MEIIAYIDANAIYLLIDFQLIDFQLIVPSLSHTVVLEGEPILYFHQSYIDNKDRWKVKASQEFYMHLNVSDSWDIQ